MYRVGLKVHNWYVVIQSVSVPNVPCGVESAFGMGLYLKIYQFLMYRVELKGIAFACASRLMSVPNVPCGVESQDIVGFLEGGKPVSS